jgi:hypothetical protein
MKHYLDLKLGPLRNISDALSSDLQEIPVLQVTSETHQQPHTNEGDFWSNYLKKTVISQLSKVSIG